MGIFHSILSSAWAYRLLDSATGGPSSRARFVHEYVRPKPGDRVLDIGCGPGNMLPYFSDVTYTGFDSNPKYIAAARTLFGDRATFICERVGSYPLQEEQRSSFDVVLAIGVVHHLDDAEALLLFRLAHAALRPGGRLITFDGCYTEDQKRLARYLLSRDRGRYVRTREAYAQIVSQVFPMMRVDIRHDLMRIPYTHIIMECKRENWS